MRFIDRQYLYFDITPRTNFVFFIDHHIMEISKIEKLFDKGFREQQILWENLF